MTLPGARRDGSDGTGDWPEVIVELDRGVDAVLADLRDRGAAGSGLLDRRPAQGGWTPREVLEHVALTDHYLLILIDKIADRTRKRLERGDPWPAHAPRLEPLRHLATREREWSAPSHMVPRGTMSADEAVGRIEEHRRRCVGLLAEFPRGEGTLHRIRMSATGLDDDRLDLYQYVEVVRLHAARHVAQIERSSA